MIVNARMYSAAPAAKQAWKSIFAWVTEKTGLPWQHLDYDAPAPLSVLWARQDLGCVMMCGYPYRQREPRPALVAAPVPSPPRYAGLPVYFTDIAVRADSPFEKIEDTFGSIVGYTLSDSMSGYVALRSFLLPYRKALARPLYREAVGGLVNARSVIEALASGRIAVGPLDSYYFDILKANDAEIAAKVKIIASTDATPIPPLVATAAISAAELAALRKALLAVGSAPELAAQRAALLLERFAVPDEASYGIIDSIAGNASEYPEAW